MQSQDDLPQIEPTEHFANLRSWTAVEMAAIRALKIPRIPWVSARNNIPDMLLYCVGELERLDDAFGPRLERLLSIPHHWCACTRQARN